MLETALGVHFQPKSVHKPPTQVWNYTAAAGVIGGVVCMHVLTVGILRDSAHSLPAHPRSYARHTNTLDGSQTLLSHSPLSHRILELQSL